MKTVTCLPKCKGYDPQCSIVECGWFTSKLLLPLVQCQIDNHCIPESQKVVVGQFFGSDETADKTVTSVQTGTTYQLKSIAFNPTKN